MRRLIYSQLPLPLGTLPRLDGIAIRPAGSGNGQSHEDEKTAKSPVTGRAVGRVYGGSGMAKSTNGMG
jgi:hypothetical protein